MLNIIDVSNWQSGLDLVKLKRGNPSLDGVIMRACHGVTDDASFETFAKAAEKAGLLMGAYIYIEGDSGEISYFINTVENLLKTSILCIDWEKDLNKRWGDLSYLRECCETVIEKTGVRPLVYASKSVFPHAVCESLNLGKWIAHYANNYRVSGFQKKPWNEDAYECAIRQYTSAGRLNGYASNLDFNKAYMSPEGWSKYANPSGEPAEDTSDDYIYVDAIIKIKKDDLQ